MNHPLHQISISLQHDLYIKVEKYFRTLTELRLCERSCDLSPNIFPSKKQYIAYVSYLQEFLLIYLIKLYRILNYHVVILTLQDLTESCFSSIPKSNFIPFEHSMVFISLKVHMLKSSVLSARSLKMRLIPFR